MDHLVVRLGIRDLEARLGADRSTIWRWYRAGKFPEPHYIGDRRVWLLSDVEAWEAAQITRKVEAWEAAQITRKASERRGAKNLRKPKVRALAAPAGHER